MNTSENRWAIHGPDDAQIATVVRVSIGAAGTVLALGAGYLIGLQRGGVPGGLTGAFISAMVFLGSYIAFGNRT